MARNRRNEQPGPQAPEGEMPPSPPLIRQPGYERINPPQEGQPQLPPGQAPGVGGKRRSRKHHSRKHHSRKHHSRKHHSRKHRSRKHHSRKHHSRKHHSRKHRSRKHK